MEPIRPEDLETFIHVCDTHSFRGAAETLDIPRPTVSRRIARLEQSLGVRLLHRTTRQVAPTPAGLEVALRARDALSALARVGRVAEVARGEPRGLLRIASAPIMGPLLCGRILHEMLAEYPELSVEMVLADRRVDLVGESFDLALRAGEVLDEQLVALSLGHAERWVVSSEVIEHPRELDGRVLAFSSGSLSFTHTSGETCTISPDPRLRVNDYGMMFEAAMRGMSAAILPHPMFRRVKPPMQRVLLDWQLSREEIHLLRPAGRISTPRVREFMERVRAALECESWPLVRG